MGILAIIPSNGVRGPTNADGALEALNALTGVRGVPPDLRWSQLFLALLFTINDSGVKPFGVDLQHCDKVDQMRCKKGVERDDLHLRAASCGSVFDAHLPQRPHLVLGLILARPAVEKEVHCARHVGSGR